MWYITPYVIKSRLYTHCTMLLLFQVLVTLDHLERVSTFQEFVQIFSQFGNEMVEFAHLTGDRQNVSST